MQMAELAGHFPTETSRRRARPLSSTQGAREPHDRYCGAVERGARDAVRRSRAQLHIAASICLAPETLNSTLVTILWICPVCSILSSDKRLLLRRQ
jgi:hypothetical protein